VENGIFYPIRDLFAISRNPGRKAFINHPTRKFIMAAINRKRLFPPGPFVRRISALFLVAGISLLLLEWLVRLFLPIYDPRGQISFVLENGFPLGPPHFEG